MSEFLGVYGCYNKNNLERMNSSSGGIYYLIAKKILNDKGVVFSACYNADLEVEHRKVDSVEMLHKSQGSKYVTSKLGNTFCMIKEYLSNKKKVLFVGTPCQCEGLLSFIGTDENLYCVDFVCHGLPSRQAWRRYLATAMIGGNQIARINMRDKSSGWSNYQYSWEFTNIDGHKCYQKQENNLFMKGFILDYYLRPSCYECCFKGIKRITDLTLGDYWGVWIEQPELDDNKGTSLIIIHTVKGEKLFDDIKEQLIYKEASIEKAIQHNPSIAFSASLNDRRKIFFDEISNGKEFFAIIERLNTPSWLEKIIHSGRKLLRKH